MTQNGSFGIDKLTVFTPNFQVEDLSTERGWSIQRAETPDAPKPNPLHRDGTGRIVYGNKAYVNTGTVRFDLDHRGLRIDLNPSKLVHPWKLAGVDVMGTVEDLIQTEADRHGLQFDPNDLRLSRLDLARQHEMTEPLSVYGHAYRLMQGKRMTTAQFPNGARFGNRQRQAVFYDKRAELIHRLKEGLGCPNKLLRAEARFMAHKAATAATGITYLHQLQKAGDGQLLESYTAFLSRDVFRVKGDGTQSIIPLENMDKVFDRIMQTTKRDAVALFERAMGINLLLVQFGGIDGYLDYLTRKGFERTTVWRAGNKVRELIELNRQMGEEGKTNADLVFELRNTFLRAA